MRCRRRSSGPFWTGQSARQRFDTMATAVARRGVVGDEGDIGEAEVLAVALVVGEEEELVLLDGAAERAAEVVALELGNLCLVEVVARVEGGVAEELVCGAVEVICA